MIIVMIDVHLQSVREVFDSSDELSLIAFEANPLIVGFVGGEIRKDERVGQCSAAAKQDINCFLDKINLHPIIVNPHLLLTQPSFVHDLIELDALNHCRVLRAAINQSLHVAGFESFSSSRCAASVLIPIFQAKPAEIDVAKRAMHVIAATVL